MNEAARFAYDLGFSLFGLVSLPHFLGRLRQAEDPLRAVRERFGFFSREAVVGPGQIHARRAGILEGPLWIHGVSVGEILSAEKFIRLLLEKHPDQSILLTTVTPTGQRLAKKWESERLKVVYFPFDLQFAVRSFFKTFQPSALLLVETEIWPNVIEEARRRNVPVAVINGRISERSFRAFLRFSFFFRPLLQSIQFFLVQTEKDRLRLLDLGVQPEQVQVTGNMKLDLLELNGLSNGEEGALRKKWGFLPEDQILVGGSTHPGEEAILLRAASRLRNEGFPLKILLAPRHIERAPQVLEESKQQGYRAELASRVRENGENSFEVLILDILGELRKLYVVADVVFMGGSLVRRGGQNPVEPACFARPIVHGRWTFNFEEIYERLNQEGASLRVNRPEELDFVLRRVLTSEHERKHLGKRAYEVLEKLRGASARNLEWFEHWSQRP